MTMESQVGAVFDGTIDKVWVDVGHSIAAGGAVVTVVRRRNDGADIGTETSSN
jgi:biotin carboxyl carrier protein